MRKREKEEEDTDVAEEFFLAPRAEFTARDSVQSPGEQMKRQEEICLR